MIAAVVLAAGTSSRMGANKLLATYRGEALVRHAVRAATLFPTIVVTGRDADEVRAALADFDVTFVHNPDFATGMASSLVAGISAVTADAAVVLLGDMPRITPSHLRALAAALGDRVVVPTHGGKRGNPVLWPASYFAAMKQLGGDVGARKLIVDPISVELDDAVLFDVDTPDALVR